MPKIQRRKRHILGCQRKIGVNYVLFEMFLKVKWSLCLVALMWPLVLWIKNRPNWPKRLNSAVKSVRERAHLQTDWQSRWPHLLKKSLNIMRQISQNTKVWCLRLLDFESDSCHNMWNIEPTNHDGSVLFFLHRRSLESSIKRLLKVCRLELMAPKIWTPANMFDRIYMMMIHNKTGDRWPGENTVHGGHLAHK